ncbi:hypothetical protein DPMN_101425 [Dreissena polymorpha]|uniref:Uncharacterized protein n=1 Tax=Dreissena polymorpha TaxID=45954 RepID=A0A9D4LL35_DREPO|nr:hypothetical protein DPMN_101425 [Dreissena polymorpha]
MVSVKKARGSGRRYGVCGKGMGHRQMIWCQWERHKTAADYMVLAKKAGIT